MNCIGREQSRERLQNCLYLAEGNMIDVPHGRHRLFCARFRFFHRLDLFKLTRVWSPNDAGVSCLHFCATCPRKNLRDVAVNWPALLFTVGLPLFVCFILPCRLIAFKRSPPQTRGLLFFFFKLTSDTCLKVFNYLFFFFFSCLLNTRNISYNYCTSAAFRRVHSFKMLHTICFERQHSFQLSSYQKKKVHGTTQKFRVYLC